MKDLSNEINLF